MVLQQPIVNHILDALQLNLILLPIGGFALFYSLFQRDRLGYWLNGYSVIWAITSIIAYVFVPNHLSWLIDTSILPLMMAIVLYATSYKRDNCWIPALLHCYFTVSMTLPLVTRLEDILGLNGLF